MTSKSGETHSFDYVVCSLPLGVLKTSKSLTFQPDLPFETKAAIGKLGFGTVNKLVMRFPTAFWRETNSSNLGPIGRVGAPFLPENQTMIGNCSGVGMEHNAFYDAGKSFGDGPSYLRPAILVSMLSGENAVGAEWSEEKCFESALAALKVSLDEDENTSHY